MKDVSRISLFSALAALTGCLNGTPQQFFSYDLSHSATSAAFKNLQPAIAVRGASCLACHANVQSNLITDFGYGSPYFLDRAMNNVADGSYYFNHELLSWQTANITGSLIIPRVTLDRSNYAPQMNTVDPAATKSSMSLAELLEAPVVADMSGASRYEGPTIQGVQPSSGPAVTEKNHVEIKAPTVSDIEGIAPELSNVSVGFTQIRAQGIPDWLILPVSGLTVVDNGAQSYVRNTSDSFVCAGDIVVKGTLFLKNLDIKTTTYGCRLYVTGTVFLQGAVTINGGARVTTENLQITSARAIMMGFNSASVRERLALSGSSRAWVLPYSYTRGAGTNTDKHTAIYNESLKITELEDGQTAALPYEHLLLNAPEIHSRYSGGFKGALVGEIIIFVLSKFAFTYDPIFEQIPVFPALNMEILRVED